MCLLFVSPVSQPGIAVSKWQCVPTRLSWLKAAPRCGFVLMQHWGASPCCTVSVWDGLCGLRGAVLCWGLFVFLGGLEGMAVCVNV